MLKFGFTVSNIYIKLLDINFYQFKTNLYSDSLYSHKPIKWYKDIIQYNIMQVKSNNSIYIWNMYMRENGKYA